MVHSPSKRWEDGRLVERAISTPVDGEPHENEPKATKEYRAPLRTPRSPEDREAYAKERAFAEPKAVQEAENKAVEPEEVKKPRKRATKKK